MKLTSYLSFVLLLTLAEFSFANHSAAHSNVRQTSAAASSRGTIAYVRDGAEIRRPSGGDDEVLFASRGGTIVGHSGDSPS